MERPAQITITGQQSTLHVAPITQIIAHKVLDPFRLFVRVGLHPARPIGEEGEQLQGCKNGRRK